MSETEIKAKLDTLAEYQAQRDLMEADKRALLEEVKVPEEIQAIVSAGMKQASEVFVSSTPEVEASIALEKAELDAIVVPEEIKEALAEIDAKRVAVSERYRAQDAQRREKIAVQQSAIQAKVEAETKGVYTALAQRKVEIEAEFAGKTEAVDENIRKLTEEIKAEVKELGASVKGEHYQGVYVKGRTSWNNDMLDGMISLVPQLEKARKIGEPSVTIRRI